VTTQGQLPERFRTPAAWLARFAETTPDAVALHLGGSLATGPVDDWSDLDACVHVVPGAERAVFDALLAALEQDWVVTDRWVLEPPVRLEGLQVFGSIADRPGAPTIIVDLEVEAVPDGGVAIDPRRHGVPIVLHDPGHVVRVEEEPDERLADDAHASARRIADRLPTARWIVDKAIARGHWTEAVGYHVRFGVEPVVQLLRTLHCPSRWDFGLRYLDADLPAGDVRRVLALLPGDPDTLSERSRDAFAWQAGLLAEVLRPER
jgi:hypothetical protein